jgi:hypothetical protein
LEVAKQTISHGKDASMDDSIHFGLPDATARQQIQRAEQLVDGAWDTLRPKFVNLIRSFLSEPLGPSAFFAMELALLALVRELGRVVLECTINSLEPRREDLLPRDLWYRCGGYRRRKEKTRNRHVATLLGTVVLWRRGYRSWDGSDRSIFPLERYLGLTAGVSPGLIDWLGRKMAEAGASQSRVLEMLRQECGVAMGVKRLRACTEQLSDAMSDLRQVHHVDLLLNALENARASRGNRKPVLAVGRDGITLREYRYRFFEVATAATVSVYDRAGKRLATVYLAWPPELGQATMDRMLTDLLRELLDRWQGPLPQLAYVTDAGGAESSYYEKTLRRMIHPHTGKQLHWQRVVDYYHVAERVWAMATALFGKDTRESGAWAHRMLKALKKPSGPSRVLHSAASHFHRRDLTQPRAKDFWKAYRYIQQRTRYLRYHEYASRHIPLGSGVTEAACKTIFTQRLKLSGMRWSHEGAKAILNLRVILLSKTWRATFATYLKTRNPTDLRPYPLPRQHHMKIAA